MKKNLLLLITAVFIVSCSSVKKTQEALNSGNYDTAINRAIEKLQDNKTKKGNQPFVMMLEEAFAKVTSRDLKHLTFLKQDGNPANYEEIYQTYVRLHSIQERIKPLLPLQIYEKNRNAQFNFNDYSQHIIDSKNKLSEYLYGNAVSLLKNSNNKYDYRQAYNDLRYIDEINPNYKDVRQKMEEAHQKGIDFVKVAMYNDTEKVIPRRLEDELLNFNTYGLNDIWTVYHNNPLKGIDYDYEMEVSFKDINISPERINEKEIIKEREVSDGWDYLKDARGNVVKDSLGNDIKIERFKVVRCNFYELTQFKSVQVSGNVTFKDLRTKQNINSYPLASEFIFQHVYANYDGDKRALEDSFIRLLSLEAVPFPSNEQMVYDAGEDLKQRLKNIITQQKF